MLCRVICKKKLAGGGSSSKASRSLVSNGGRETAPTTSPPLPPLMDTTLAQLQVAMNTTTAGALEQVPCFSNFNNIASNSNGNGNSAAAAAAQPCFLPMATGGSHGMSYLDHGLLPELGGCFDPLNSDKKLLKAVLSQFGGDVVPTNLQHEMAAGTAATSTWMNHF